MVKIKNFFLKEIFFNDGVWMGKFEFEIEIDNISNLGIVPFTYSQEKFNLHGLTYPSVISIEERKEVRKKVIKESKTFLNELENNIILPRDKNSFKPVIANYEIMKKNDVNNIIMHFKLKENPIDFIAYIFLYNNFWHYEIKTKTFQKNNDYIRYTDWQDDIFDLLVDILKTENSYRMKFVTRGLKYKNKKRDL